ncbi:Hypothetical predicted protein, partial [Pelobates cultripes]
MKVEGKVKFATLAERDSSISGDSRVPKMVERFSRDYGAKMGAVGPPVKKSMNQTRLRRSGDERTLGSRTQKQPNGKTRTEQLGVWE